MWHNATSRNKKDKPRTFVEGVQHLMAGVHTCIEHYNTPQGRQEALEEERQLEELRKMED